MVFFSCIGERASKENNFDLARLIAALLVVFGHSFALNVTSGTDIFRLLHFTSAHRSGLYMFFLMSGFLLTQSIERGADPVFFIKSRLLRLVPGLAVSLIVTLFLIAPFSSWFPFGPAFLKEAARFFLTNLSFLGTESGNFGVFAQNRVPGAVNGSLWSIAWEVKCYLLLFTLLISGVLRRRSTKWAAYGVGSCLVFLFPAFLWEEARGSIYHICVCFFWVGSILYQARNYVPYHWVLPVAGVAAIYGLTDVIPSDTLNFLRWAVIALTPFSIAFCLKPIKLPGDYSYGIYVYAFSIQQILAQLYPALPPLEAFGVSMMLILPLAVLSWHLIESKMLRFKNVPLKSRSNLVFLCGFGLVFVLSLLLRKGQIFWPWLWAAFLLWGAYRLFERRKKRILASLAG